MDFQKNITYFFRFFLFILDLLFYLVPTKRNSGDAKKLLIVRVDAIGDFIIFLDSLKEYRKLYPEWEITLLGNKVWADLAENLPYVDNYLFTDRIRFLSDPFYRFSVYRKIRKVGFDTVIHPIISREFLYGDSIVRASGAAEKVGSVGNYLCIGPMAKRVSDRWYTQLLPVSDVPMTELERNAEFLKGLGLKRFIATKPVYPIEVLLTGPQDSLFQIVEAYFIIFPGAGTTWRQWPKKKFAATARLLYEQTGWKPILCGASGENKLAEEIIDLSPELPWLNLAGKTSLSQLARIMGKAKFLLGNETGAVHIAASVGCPVVCIMGGGHFGRFFPYGSHEQNRIVFRKMDCYGCNWQCVYSTVRCIEDVSVTDVLQEALSVVALNRDTANRC